MSLPEQEPEPRPSNFRVKIGDLLSIHSATQRGVSGDLGIALLTDPLELVTVSLQSQEGEYNLYGVIKMNNDSPATLVTETFKNAGRRYKKETAGSLLTESNKGYIITTPAGNTFIICRHPYIITPEVYVTTGSIKEPGAYLQITPGPKPGSPLDIETVLKEFADVLQITVDEAYKLAGKDVAEAELVLRGPRQPLEGPSAIGGPPVEKPFLQKTPENLLGKIEIERPDVSFEDIGGQAGPKKEIQGLAFALKNPELYKKWGTKPPKGIILYGSPGTGKTLMAKALASQADARFFHVMASDIASKWYGESEQIVRDIFELASQNGGKTIIFFDEVDAIAPQREGAHEVTKRVVSTLLENMDGIGANDNVMVVASTNRLEGIDPALLRAGRFDRWVEVPLPDEEGRRQIFGIHMNRAEVVAGRTLFESVSLDAIIPKTEKSSGADIAEIIRRVLEEKVRQEGTGQQPTLVTTENILSQIKSYERVRETKRSIGFVTRQN